MQESANVKWSREKKGETPRNSWLLKFAFILDKKKKNPLRSRMKRESEQEQEVSKQERKKGEGRRKA